MTEIALPNDSGKLDTPAEQPEPGSMPFQDSALVQWAYEARQANQIAQSLAQTSFVPASMRGKVGDVTGAILAGQELGLPPVAALRSIDIIQGTPALRAHAMRGLVQSKGHEVELIDSTPDKCVMRGRRAGKENWQTVTWDIPRAELMGLTSKGEWKKQPQTMLVARATGEICRLIASDVLHAMPYAAEELDNQQPDTAAASMVTVAEVLQRDSDTPEQGDTP
jgi:hypothetical protein